MPVIYNAAVKTDRMTATRDYFAEGTLEIRSAGNGGAGAAGAIIIEYQPAAPDKNILFYVY
jgi:hypothetical protein